MVKKVQKITLSSSRDIPFNQLVLSQANVRRVKAGLSVEELAEDIARRSLLQSLFVRPLLDAEGAETGLYDVPAGGRRFRALELLVKQKRLSRTAPVPCVVRDAATDILAEDDSLAENVQRAPLHPLDQFRAFQAMREKGRSEEDIAAAFFVPVTVVKQRLRLAAVSPKLLDAYAEDGLSLDQLMAFTVSADHARQEQVWETVSGSWSKEPYQIRRMLTERTVRASDRRAQFVGLAAYEEAGGSVLRDLFQLDDGGWLEDIGLLDGLVADKLKREADAVAMEGWKWVEVAVSFPYDHTNQLRRLTGVAAGLTTEERSAIDALQAESRALEAEYEGADELPDAIDVRLGEIEAELAAVENRPQTYDPAEIARAGAFVSVDAEGGLRIDRGYVRPEDEAPAADAHDTTDHETGAGKGEASHLPGVTRTVITIGGQPAAPEDDDDDLVRPLPERLVTELTAHRTLALRDAVARHPHAAMTMLLHKLVTDMVQRAPSSGTCLDVSVRHVFFPVQAPHLKDSPPATAIAARHEAWRSDLPHDDQALWDRLDSLDDASRLALLAHCVSYGVNALVEKIDRYGGAGLSQHALDRRLGQADRLAGAVGLDMVEAGWTPTVGNYLGRVTKPRILDAVREAKGEASVQLIEHLKKADMATEAERLLDGTGWLPEMLRHRTDAPIVDQEADDETLPSFLLNGEGADVQQDIAAE